MDKKKGIIAIVLFVFLGLMVFSFANPNDGITELEDGDKTSANQLVNTRSDDAEVSLVSTDEDEENESNNNSLTVVHSSGTNNSSNNDSTVIPSTNTSSGEENTGSQTGDYSSVVAMVEKIEEQIKSAKTINTARTDYESVKSAVESIEDETVKKTLSERLNAVTPIINDTVAPKILVNGEEVKENAIYNGEVVITVKDDTATTTKLITLDGEEIDSVETLTDGIYEITIVDSAFNETTIKFTYDATINIAGITEETYTYDGIGVTPSTTDEDIKSVVLTKDEESIENYELGTAIINAGVYELRVTDNAGNVKTISFEIKKVTPTIEIVEPTLVYNGEKQEYEIIVKDIDGNIVKNPSMNVVYKDANTKEDLNGAPVNAGDYIIGIYVRPTDNYTRADKWFNFTVEKATTEFVFTAPNSLVYDMEAKEYAVKLITSYGEELNVKTTVAYEAEDGTRGDAINAGKYTLIAHYAGDANHIATYKREAFEITKAETEIVINVPKKLVYDGEEKNATASLMIKGTNKKVKDLNVVYDDANGRLASAPVNAGQYTAIAHFGGDDNLVKSYARKDFTINKLIVTAYLQVPENMEYDGKAKNVTVVFKDQDGNVVDGIKYNLMARYSLEDKKYWVTEVKEVGSYEMVVWLDTESAANLETTNPGANIGVVEVTEAVTKAKVTMTVEYPKEGMAYTGNVKKLKLVFTDSEGNEITDIKASYSVLNEDFNSYVELKEVGKYMVKVNITDESLDKYDIDYTSWLSVEITEAEKKDEYTHVLVALDKNYISYQEIKEDDKTIGVYTYNYDGNAKGFVLNLYHNGKDVTSEADILMLYQPKEGNVLFNAPSEVGTYDILPLGMPSEYNSDYHARVVILPTE